MRFVNKRTHKRNEAKDFVFAIHNSRVYFHGDENDRIWDKILECVEELKDKKKYDIMTRTRIPYEAPFRQGDGVIEGLPDIIYEGDEIVIGIEHFEFDAGGISRKGSKMRLAEIEAERKILLKVKEREDSPIFEEAPVNIAFSYEGYVSSLLDNFKTHAEKIKKYRLSLEKNYPAKKIVFAFYIEDITALGNYIVNHDEEEPMCPILVKEFIDSLVLYQGIDYIICRIQNHYVYQIRIYQITNDMIEKLYKEVYDMEKEQYVSYHYKRTTHIYGLDDDDDE